MIQPRQKAVSSATLAAQPWYVDAQGSSKQVVDRLLHLSIPAWSLENQWSFFHRSNFVASKEEMTVRKKWHRVVARTSC